ncbi:PC-esterase domain-containing protein 1A isoform X2 [Nilaparvata lugens]|uniref:PC-esterase domain-containing protein 1A isoform X2 n=1 Tax=Nilaparvata lugens TaxID=108931 RepID=UPI00193E63F2|nr:PC-esterase domain-containing protein 1A isoform X2 [Nilaparvata lugens]
MADIFFMPDARLLLRNRSLLFLGGSNTRAVYKDLIWLLQRGTLIDNSCLRQKLEPSFLGDKLVERSSLHKGRNFVETRHYEMNNMKIHFQFITRCYNEAIEELFTSFKATQHYPNVVFISSLLWDITRWGPDGVDAYKENMVKLMDLMKSTLPPSTLVIWGTTLPISSDVRSGGFLIKQIEFMKHTMRFEVMEGNLFASRLVSSHGFDVLDLHYNMRMQIHRRCKDGIHFISMAVRHVTNLLLSHIALTWDYKLPGNYVSKQLLGMLGTDALGNPFNRDNSGIYQSNTPMTQTNQQGNTHKQTVPQQRRKILRGKSRRRNIF